MLVGEVSMARHIIADFRNLVGLVQKEAVLVDTARTGRDNEGRGLGV
jgi:hypothetical protein